MFKKENVEYIELENELTKNEMIMIGDASDAVRDFSDSDKMTAQNYGIDYVDVRDFLGM